MTLNQLESLTEDELAMVLYIVNVVSPLDIPKIQFEPKHLTWFRHEALIKKLLDAFPKVLPSGHATYVSLMEKLGIKGEIKYGPQPVQQSTNNNSQASGSSSEVHEQNSSGNDATGSIP